MKRIILFGMALIAVVFLPSCVGKEDPVQNPVNQNPTNQNPSQGNQTAPEVSITTGSQTLSSAGGNATIAFSATGAWTAASNVDWITLGQTSGNPGSVTINVTIKENGEYDQRDGLILISSGNVSKSISVVQKQKDALLVTSNSIILDEKGGSPTIEVKSNIDYSCKVDDDSKSWISIVSTRALTTSNITLSISENTEPTDRQGNVLISSGDKTEVVTVYQKASTRASTTSLAGTSWYYTYLYNSSSSSYSETRIMSFRTDGTFIYSDWDRGYCDDYSYGTYESDGAIFKLTLQGHVSIDGQKHTSAYPKYYTAEIIDNVLYVYFASGALWLRLFKL